MAITKEHLLGREKKSVMNANVASLYFEHGCMLVASKVIFAYRGSVAVSSRDTQPFT